MFTWVLSGNRHLLHGPRGLPYASVSGIPVRWVFGSFRLPGGVLAAGFSLRRAGEFGILSSRLEHLLRVLRA